MRWLLVRHRRNWVLLFRFAAVGATGVLVNLLVLAVCRALGAPVEGVAIDLPGTEYNVRWYHVYSTIAFAVANVWNFQLNRWWTFGSAKFSAWWREYAPFLLVGLAAQAVGLGILTLLMHQDSPISLSPEIFDDSSVLRTRVYWAQLISVLVITPLSFALNKVWTFRRVRALARVMSHDDDIQIAGAPPPR